MYTALQADDPFLRQKLFRGSSLTWARETQQVSTNPDRFSLLTVLFRVVSYSNLLLKRLSVVDCRPFCNAAVICVFLACSFIAHFGLCRCTICMFQLLHMKNRSNNTSLRFHWMMIKIWSVVQLSFLFHYCMLMHSFRMHVCNSIVLGPLMIAVHSEWLLQGTAFYTTCDTVYLFCKCLKI